MVAGTGEGRGGERKRRREGLGRVPGSPVVELVGSGEPPEDVVEEAIAAEEGAADPEVQVQDIVRALPASVRRALEGVELAVGDRLTVFDMAESTGNRRVRWSLWQVVDSLARIVEQQAPRSPARRAAFRAWRALWGLQELQLQGGASQGFPYNPLLVREYLWALRGVPVFEGDVSEMSVDLTRRLQRGALDLAGVPPAAWKRVEAIAVAGAGRSAGGGEGGDPAWRLCLWLVQETAKIKEQNENVAKSAEDTEKRVTSVFERMTLLTAQGLAQGPRLLQSFLGDNPDAVQAKLMAIGAQIQDFARRGAEAKRVFDEIVIESDAVLRDHRRQNALLELEDLRAANEERIRIAQVFGAKQEELEKIQTANRIRENQLRARNAVSTLSFISNSALRENKRAFEIIKLADIAQATADTFTAANRALALEGPLGFAAAGAVIAAGLANVARIRATQFGGGGGGGGGGGPSGGIGSGGIDSANQQSAVTPTPTPQSQTVERIVNVNLTVEGLAVLPNQNQAEEFLADAIVGAQTAGKITFAG